MNMLLLAAALWAGGLSDIKLPPGFTIERYAEVPDARSLALGPDGIVFVGTRGNAVYAVDGKRRVHRLASGLRQPNGVAFKDGALYVAEISRILRYDGIAEKLDSPPKPVVLRDDLPRDGHHGWKFIAFGPDGNLYVPVGAPCNVCLKDDERYASILRFSADGSRQEVFARGVRNTVGFDWHPGTKELWFTDNGRDWLGDDLPPDELNRAPRPGLHFGFPHCHGRSHEDPKFGKDCSAFQAPERELGPHVAALGMRFYTGTRFPAEYRGQVFIAEHGSWNRSKPIGYRLMLARLRRGSVTYEPFAEGWLRDGEVSGRPVDVLVMPDGALLVSDDENGALYRIDFSSSGVR